MKIAYICDGLVPDCSGKLHCFKCPGPVFDDSMVCRHTTDPLHAINEITDDPENEVPQRFKRYVSYDGDIRYFEEPEKEDS